MGIWDRRRTGVSRKRGDDRTFRLTRLGALVPPLALQRILLLALAMANLAEAYLRFSLHAQLSLLSFAMAVAIIGTLAFSWPARRRISERRQTYWRGDPQPMMGGNYYIHLVCPFCHRSKWMLATELGATCSDLLNTFWEFECPVHGPLREKPLQAQEKLALPWLEE